MGNEGYGLGAVGDGEHGMWRALGSVRQRRGTCPRVRVHGGDVLCACCDAGMPQTRGNTRAICHASGRWRAVVISC